MKPLKKDTKLKKKIEVETPDITGNGLELFKNKIFKDGVLIGSFPTPEIANKKFKKMKFNEIYNG